MRGGSNVTNERSKITQTSIGPRKLSGTDELADADAAIGGADTAITLNHLAFRNVRCGGRVEHELKRSMWRACLTSPMLQACLIKVLIRCGGHVSNVILFFKISMWRNFHTGDVDVL